MPRPVSNPPNPWHTAHVDWLGEPPPARLEVFEEEAKSILSENDSPDIGFRYSLNPYRGCYHGCAYCYARPSHQYLGYGAGTDFDRKLVAKTNAPELLRAAFLRPSWRGEWVALSGNTDCYQPLEAAYGLTRRCLEVFLEFRNPVGVITKGALIRRDADLLAELARVARATVTISIPFADDETGRKVEPYASKSSERFAAMRALADAGVPVGINIAPVIPGLSDSDIPELLERARDAGARRAHIQMLRLPAEVLPVFDERMAAAFPEERKRKIDSALVAIRGGGGKRNESRFGARMTGVGPRWAVLEALFQQHARRLGLHHDDRWCEPADTFRRPPPRQTTLFPME